jgi:hypothetical protein
LHQYQRPEKSAKHKGKEVQYIEVSKEDIKTANRLAHEVLGRSLDELPPQTRRLLVQLDEMVTEVCKSKEMERSDYRFTRRMVREHTGMGNTQLRLHLDRLVDLEYLLVHHGSRGQSFVYELLYDGRCKENKPFMMGLIEVEKLENHEYDLNLAGSGLNLAGQSGELAGSKRVQNGPKTGGWRGGKNHKNLNIEEDLESESEKVVKNALKGSKEPIKSYVLIDSKEKYPLAAKEGAC